MLSVNHNPATFESLRSEIPHLRRLAALVKSPGGEAIIDVYESATDEAERFGIVFERG